MYLRQYNMPVINNIKSCFYMKLSVLRIAFKFLFLIDFYFPWFFAIER